MHLPATSEVGGLSLADRPRRWTAASAKSCAATLTATIPAPVAVPNRGQSASDSPPAVEAAALPAAPGTGVESACLPFSVHACTCQRHRKWGDCHSLTVPVAGPRRQQKAAPQL